MPNASCCFGAASAYLLWRLRWRAVNQDVVPFLRQAGGHPAFQSRRQGIFLKPIQGKQKFEQNKQNLANQKSRGEIEADFYAEVAALKGSSSVHCALATFLPRCEGMQMVCGKQYLAMEDLTASYQSPCVLDLKMGTIVTEPGVPAAEAEKRRLKRPLQGVFGYGIVGMHVFDVKKGEYHTYGKNFGKELTAEQMQQGEGLLAFVNNGSGFYRMDVLREMRRQLCPILEWFNKQQVYTFFSTSLLIIYEGSAAAAVQRKPCLTVKMIDFAHVLKSVEGPDRGYLEGLRSLQKVLDVLVSEKGVTDLSRP
jgi:hypothetical protein